MLAPWKPEAMLRAGWGRSAASPTKGGSTAPALQRIAFPTSLLYDSARASARSPAWIEADSFWLGF